MMKKEPRIIALDFPMAHSTESESFVQSEIALFDFDVVVIRAPDFGLIDPGQPAIFQHLRAMMDKKSRELDALLAQGGVLVVFLSAPSYYSVTHRFAHNTLYLGNYEFLDPLFTKGVREAKGQQVIYDGTEPAFERALKKSTVSWTAYLAQVPARFAPMKFFAKAGSAGYLAGKMPSREGHIFVLPNVTALDEQSFIEACEEYRFKKQGTQAPPWVQGISVPGIKKIEDSIENLNAEIEKLAKARRAEEQALENIAAYRKLLYEKGQAQLEPIALRGLDDLGFGTTPGGIIKETNYEIDGRTTKGSLPGLVEVKGSKKVIALAEFSPLVAKVIADLQVCGVQSKGILIGNGLCEDPPASRLGDKAFSDHVLETGRRNSIALINSVELYWLCCAILRGDAIDKNAAREAVLTGNGYVDLKPFCGASIF